jgi:hypothetical protein
MADKPKPHKIRGAGGITAAVWKNDGANGPFYTVTPTRNYKDSDGNWKETNSYHQHDLLELAEVLREARSYILNELSAAKAAQHGHDAEQQSYSDRETGRKRAGGQQR